ncbi:DUF222 domain-containing protein [Phycicoccus sp. BSK3Z-2]|uniref:DUF222 domain-containing protein n=1 Tax=Phycicoccus avicenniae TaxID=2828860 RepID=A0A941I1T9_9MICO|nr:HNH endonuclease signature motif containing protein [Phycicoccus avicenniae]MBR7744379.1 DUF222 domain-containing protein [Phycicoccus avicenniae]
MGQGDVGLAERRFAVEAARVALEGLSSVLHQASGAELGELLTEVDGLAAVAGAARVSVTAEAVSRGEVADAGTNAHGWVREHAPSLRQGGAGHVAAMASAMTAGGALWSTGAGPDPDSPTGMVVGEVVTGRVGAPLATAVLREVDRLAPRLRPEALPTVTGALLDLGVQWGPSVMRRLRPRLLAEHGLPGELDGLQDRLASGALLSAPVVESGDLTEYRLLMTPEQSAVLEAAIGPLSAPAPDDATGQRDLRPAGQRRVEALTTVCRRSSALGAAGADGAAGSAAALHVTMALTDLQERTGCAEVLGSVAAGTLLAPGTVRRVACDADLVPHVLGSAGELLDLGRTVRLFTRAQRRALWLRDRCCTYPGCGAPAAWTQAHHVVHWADGGASDLANAALLCQRHHTLVHTRGLVADVLPAPDEHGRTVVWDLTPGSYDRHLTRLRARADDTDRRQRARRLLLDAFGDPRDDTRPYELPPDDPRPHVAA